MGINELKAQILALPEAERHDLVEVIVESLGGDDSVVLHPAWEDEIKRRDAAMQSGEMEMIPGDEFDAELSRLLSKE